MTKDSILYCSIKLAFFLTVYMFGSCNESTDNYIWGGAITQQTRAVDTHESPNHDADVYKRHKNAVAVLSERHRMKECSS